MRRGKLDTSSFSFFCLVSFLLPFSLIFFDLIFWILVWFHATKKENRKCMRDLQHWSILRRSLDLLHHFSKFSWRFGVVTEKKTREKHETTRRKQEKEGKKGGRMMMFSNKREREDNHSSFQNTSAMNVWFTNKRSSNLQVQYQRFQSEVAMQSPTEVSNTLLTDATVPASHTNKTNQV